MQVARVKQVFSTSTFFPGLIFSGIISTPVIYPDHTVSGQELRENPIISHLTGPHPWFLAVRYISTFIHPDILLLDCDSMTQPRVCFIPILLFFVLAGGVAVQGSAAAQNHDAEQFSCISFPGSLNAYIPSYYSQGTGRSLLANNSFSGAYFTGNPLEGDPPLTVAFMDLSAQTGNAWYWDFGDGSSSQEQNPVHTFTVPGTYSITLTITRKISRPGSEYEFSSTIKRDNYIVVHGIPPAPLPPFTPGSTSTLPVLTPRYTPSFHEVTLTPSLVPIRPLSPGSGIVVPSVSPSIAAGLARYAFVSGPGPEGTVAAPAFPPATPVMVKMRLSSPSLTWS